MTRLSEQQRAALRRHYLMRCALLGDGSWSWLCSCREDGGTEPTANDCHRLFGQHLAAVKLLNGP